MRMSQMLIPTTKNPPAKVKDPALIRAAKAGVVAYDAAEKRLLWLPLGVKVLERFRTKALWIAEESGFSVVDCGINPSGTLPIAVRILKNESQLPLTLTEVSPREALFEGFASDEEEGHEAAFNCLKGIREMLIDLDLEVLEPLSEVAFSGTRWHLAVKGDKEAIGGLLGVSCPACGWTGLAHSFQERSLSEEEGEENPLEEIETPKATTIAELCRQVGCPPSRTLKTMFYGYGEGREGHILAALISGDRQISLVKLSCHVGSPVHRASQEEIVSAVGGLAGYLGPVGLPKTVRLVADRSLVGTKNRIAGANKPDKHLKGVSWGRDYEAEVADIEAFLPQSPCPLCETSLVESPLRLLCTLDLFNEEAEACPSLTYLDSQREKRKPFSWRLRLFMESLFLAALSGGKALKRTISPFDVHLIASDDQEPLLARCSALEALLERRGLRVLVDDRSTPLKDKVQDALNLRFPLQLVVGRDFEENLECLLADGSLKPLVLEELLRDTDQLLS